MAPPRSQPLGKSRPVPPPARDRIAWALAVAWVGFLVAIAWAVARWLDPVAWFYGAAPVFSASTEFVRPWLGTPGGPAFIVSAWLGQSAYHSILGPAVVAGLVALLGGTGWWLTRADGVAAWTWVIPPGVFLLALSRYVPGPFEVGVLLSCVQTALILWQVAARSGSMRGVVLGGLAAVLFYVAGPLPSLSFILAAAVQWERAPGMTTAHRATAAAAVVLWAVAAWLTGGIDPAGLGPRLASRELMIAAVVAGFWFVLCGATELALRLVLRERPWTGARLARWLAPLAAAAMLIACFRSVDPIERALLRIQSRAERQDWKGVLGAAGELSYLPPAARLQVIRALYHEGRLLDELFSFPNRKGADLLPTLVDGLSVSLPLYDTLLELGHVNLAEHYVHEAIEVRGERPEILWRLAWINLIKDRPEAARVFLNRLSWVPFHRALARRWLRAIDKDPTLAQEPSVVAARQRRVTVDQVERRFSTPELLAQSLQTSHGDPMPVQYLMAHFLLADEPQAVARNLGQLAPSSRLPRHVAEAVLAVQPRIGILDLAGRSIDAEVNARFNRFAALAARGPQEAGVEAALRGEFADTFWFYELFGRSASKGAAP